MKDEVSVIIVAVICLTLIEVMALYQGLDGALLSLMVGAITTIVGYVYGKKEKTKEAQRQGEA